MSTEHKNLSEFDSEHMPSAADMRFGIVVSAWNKIVTGALYEGVERTLTRMGCKTDNILRYEVPGGYELPLGAKWVFDSFQPDAVICLGCVVQGETPHFDYICQAISNGIMDLNLQYGKPFIFGVLTTNTMQQALDRAGGKHGNKGVEAAVAAIQMVDLHRRK